MTLPWATTSTGISPATHWILRTAGAPSRAGGIITLFSLLVCTRQRRTLPPRAAQRPLPMRALPNLICSSALDLTDGTQTVLTAQALAFLRAPNVDSL